MSGLHHLIYCFNFSFHFLQKNHFYRTKSSFRPNFKTWDLAKSPRFYKLLFHHYSLQQGSTLWIAIISKSYPPHSTGHTLSHPTHWILLTAVVLAHVHLTWKVCGTKSVMHFYVILLTGIALVHVHLTWNVCSIKSLIMHFHVWIFCFTIGWSSFCCM